MKYLYKSYISYLCIRKILIRIHVVKYADLFEQSVAINHLFVSYKRAQFEIRRNTVKSTNIIEWNIAEKYSWIILQDEKA